MKDDQSGVTALKNTQDNWAGQKAASARFPVALKLLEDGEGMNFTDLFVIFLNSKFNSNSILQKNTFCLQETFRIRQTMINLINHKIIVHFST